ncbi:hypothetical protein BB558_002507 [Smittium angustum]|uniref:rRNA adenine N(6)-methyltransferase n=1 Tax=Smittium angustum TaxID=133377 RepID=A0A2U1J8H8_SMIAN|nr:hypothetical protein BB558_005929 [Smittium angustum]PWA01400.1 hypothetical protein BB558_002507 [Smittium angustum]
MVLTKLPPLPTIRDLIRIYGISAKSKLSQNFILDKNVTDKIVSKANPAKNNTLVIEVGPGPGLLTRSLLDYGSLNIIGIEKDERFYPSLCQLSEASENRFIPIIDDMLKIDHMKILDVYKQNFDSEIENVHLIGNLPFNISTPLLTSWLRMLYNKEGIFSLPNPKLTLMFQKEVGQRIAADAGNNLRGRLSVMSQSICNVRELYAVKSSSFVPQPKVNAIVVGLEPLETPLLECKMWNPEMLPLLEEANIMSFLRPQDIETEAICKLAKILEDRNIQLPQS